MRRFTVPFLVGAVLFMSAIGVSVRPSVFAQEATPTGMATMATHPVVGTWDMTGAIDDDTFPFLAIFHADGTYQEIYPWGAIFFGVWKPTGERTAEGTNVGYGLTDDRLERGEGRWTAEVDETGNAIATDGTFVSRFVDDGSIGLAIEGPSPGTRLTVLPMVSLEELVPEGTPVTAVEQTGAATPTP